MITTKQQYEGTKVEVTIIVEELKKLDRSKEDDPGKEIYRDALRSTLEEFEADIAEYETRRNNDKRPTLLNRIFAMLPTGRK